MIDNLLNHTLLFTNARFHTFVLVYPRLMAYASILAPSFFSCICMAAMFAFRMEECTSSLPCNLPVGSPIREVAPPSCAGSVKLFNHPPSR